MVFLLVNTPLSYPVFAGPRSTISRAPDSLVRGPGFDSWSGNISPSAFSRRAVVSYWRKYVHKVLVNRLRGLSLPRKSVVRLTDRPDMTLYVYRGRKTTMQQQQQHTLFSVLTPKVPNKNCSRKHFNLFNFHLSKKIRLMFHVNPLPSTGFT